MKRCSICQREFPATTEYFPLDRTNKDGFRPQCKVCSAARQKAYRSADPKRYSEYARTAYLRNPGVVKSRVRTWQRSPIGKTAVRRYRLENLEIYKQRKREYYLNHREQRLEAAARWQRANPLRKSAIRQRRAARKSNLPDTFTASDWEFALAHFGGRCAVCGQLPKLWNTLAMDHWIALSSPDCPGTIPTNIVPLCNGLDGCNTRKNASDPAAWVNRTFGESEGVKILARIAEYFDRLRFSEESAT